MYGDGVGSQKSRWCKVVIVNKHNFSLCATTYELRNYTIAG